MQNIFDIKQGLIIWVLAIIVVIVIQRRRENTSVGLVIAYILTLSMNHLLGALIYALPWYYTAATAAVEAGFQQTVYGMVAFSLGATVLASPLYRFFQSINRREYVTSVVVGNVSFPSPKLYVVIGLASYLVIFPLAGSLPTLTSIIATANQLLVVGICMACWLAQQESNQRSFRNWITIAFLLPLMTIITQGFIGYGVVALGTVLLFVYSFARFRWQMVLVGVVIGYIAISFWISYMRDRDLIRTSVWGGQSLNNRAGQLFNTISQIEWFDLHNPQHLQAIDGRLNQNFLVGAAVYNLSSGYRDYAKGTTLWQAVIGLVPRVLWPDKPITAGSGSIVSDYTGIQFGKGTSVGVGQVMEFYINFGTAGVLVGFLILGALVSLFDQMAADNLSQGRWQSFTIWFLAGLGFLQSGGSLVDVSTTVAAGAVTAILVTRCVRSTSLLKTMPAPNAEVQLPLQVHRPAP